MKEYLERQIDGSYKLIESATGEHDWIRVPEGAEIYLQGNYFNFLRREANGRFESTNKSGVWYDSAFQSELDDGYLPVLWQRPQQPEELPFIDDEPKHNHYFKDVSDLDVVDVYQVLKLFNVTDPCLQHIVKKALCAGERGHKDFSRDLQDIFDTAKRALEINNI